MRKHEKFLFRALGSHKHMFTVWVIHHPVFVCMCVSQDESSLFAGLSDCLAPKAAGETS